MKFLRLFSILFATLFLLSSCSEPEKKDSIIVSESKPEETSVYDENTTDSSKSETENSHPRDENNTYRAHLSVVSALPTEYNGDELSVTMRVENSGDPFEQAFILFVNGERTDYSTDEFPDKAFYHVYSIPKDESVEITLYFSPYNCKKGEKAIVSLASMLNPNYMLKDTSYVSFQNNHKIARPWPFEISINKDAPENEYNMVSNDFQTIEITEEYAREQQYIYESMGETHNSLKNNTTFKMYQNDSLESYITANDILKLNITAAGKGENNSGKYLVGIYINHELQKAFGDNYYAICNADGEHETRITANIDVSNLSGLNHIYMIAAPYDPKDAEIGAAPEKTDTKLLYIGESSTIGKDTSQPPDDTVSSTDSNLSSGIKENKWSAETDYAQDFFILENENMLFVKQPSRPSFIDSSPAENGSITIYDSQIKEKISVISIDFKSSIMVKVQIVKDGFAVIDSNGGFIKLYDNDGNEIKTINPPIYDFAAYAVSYDKLRIAYCYWDSDIGLSRLCTDSIALNDRKEIMTFDAPDEIGALTAIDSIFSYKDGIIAFGGNAAKEITPKLKTSAAYGTINDSGENFTLNKLEELEILNTNLTSQENYFVVIEDYNPDSSILSSGIVKYQGYNGDKIGSLTCEKTEENHYAVISDDGKYIATLINSTNLEEVGIIKIYDVENGNLLYSTSLNTEPCVQGIRFNEKNRTVYIFFGNLIYGIEF